MTLIKLFTNWERVRRLKREINSELSEIGRRCAEISRTEKFEAGELRELTSPLEIRGRELYERLERLSKYDFGGLFFGLENRTYSYNTATYNLGLKTADI